MGGESLAVALSEVRAQVRPPAPVSPRDSEDWTVELALAEPVAQWLHDEAAGQARSAALVACGREVISFRVGLGIVLPDKAFVSGFPTREAAMDVVARLQAPGPC